MSSKNDNGDKNITYSGSDSMNNPTNGNQNIDTNSVGLIHKKTCYNT